MDFALNEEQLELQEMVRDFVEKEITPYAGENAPKAAKKKATKARMDKAEEDAINASKAAAFMSKAA